MRFHWTELSALGFNYCRDELPAPNEWPSSYLLNPASARLGVIVESPFDISTDTLLFLTCEFERLLCFLGSREGSVGHFPFSEQNFNSALPLSVCLKKVAWTLLRLPSSWWELLLVPSLLIFDTEAQPERSQNVSEEARSGKAWRSKSVSLSGLKRQDSRAGAATCALGNLKFQKWRQPANRLRQKHAATSYITDAPPRMQMSVGIMKSKNGSVQSVAARPTTRQKKMRWLN